MKLTPIQQAYIPAILWLIDDNFPSANRATGRSTLLAYAFLMKAMENPGKKILIWDHDSANNYNERSIRYVVNLIKMIYQEDYAIEWNLKYYETDRAIVMTQIKEKL